MVNVDEVIELARSGAIDLRAELREVAGFVAVAVAAVINLFNPATVFIHTPLFEIDATLFDTVVAQARGACAAAVVRGLPDRAREGQQASGCGRGHHSALDGFGGAGTGVKSSEQWTVAE